LQRLDLRYIVCQLRSQFLSLNPKSPIENPKFFFALPQQVTPHRITLSALASTFGGIA
jgi:hypothetical protein